jgi:hypothetical protein
MLCPLARSEVTQRETVGIETLTSPALSPVITWSGSLAVAKQFAVERGYDDIDPALVWEQWQARRVIPAAAHDPRADN